MSDQPSPTNPYEPPHESIAIKEGRLPLPLGNVYWRLTFAAFVVEALLVCTPIFFQASEGKLRPFWPNLFVSPSSGLGLFGGLVSGFALAYGLSYAHRVATQNFTHRYNEAREHQFDFYARTMLFGVLLAISTLTAFVGCCVPASLPFIRYSAGGGTSGSTAPATAFSVLVALAVGGFVIYKLLPREDLQ